ncbi:MAG: DNA-protecting protein DprA, partial [Bacteroidota bacterium]|nr:DNA-protecting protein DprA [Bacteroidota bacterium]
MSTFSYKELFDNFTDIEKKIAPRNLFFNGDATLLHSGLKVSVVGSRNPSDEGVSNTRCIAETLVKNGVIIVSGLAKGIDTIAHETAIKMGGKTIAVLGSPLNRAYPAQNEDLLRIIRERHLAVSQFPEGYPIKKENFPIRNRTMALLSDATIIVEASEKSGTRHQGWEALRLGRLVFILKEIIDNPGLTWPGEMIKYGAQELTCELLPSFLEEIPHFTSRLNYD